MQIVKVCINKIKNPVPSHEFYETNHKYKAAEVQCGEKNSPM